jgi:thiol-disulfide isomerase/thioredoxin
MKSVAYHFWGADCGPCMRLKPSMLEMSEEFPNIEWVSVDVRNTKTDLIQRYGVGPIPCLVVIVKNDVGKDIYSEKCTDRTSITPYFKTMQNALNFIKNTTQQS